MITPIDKLHEARGKEFFNKYNKNPRGFMPDTWVKETAKKFAEKFTKAKENNLLSCYNCGSSYRSTDKRLNGRLILQCTKCGRIYVP